MWDSQGFQLGVPSRSWEKAGEEKAVRSLHQLYSGIKRKLFSGALYAVGCFTIFVDFLLVTVHILRVTRVFWQDIQQSGEASHSRPRWVWGQMTNLKYSDIVLSLVYCSLVWFQPYQAFIHSWLTGTEGRGRWVTYGVRQAEEPTVVGSRKGN